VGELRRAVLALLHGSDGGGDGEQASSAFSIALAVSEACTNVVRHAYPHGDPGTITLIAFVSGGFVRITVKDDGVGVDRPSNDPGLGLGLELMERLAPALLVRSGKRGTTVDMAFPTEAFAAVEQLDDDQLARDAHVVNARSEEEQDEVILLALLRRAAELHQEFSRRSSGREHAHAR
jgi:hypothetical protein